MMSKYGFSVGLVKRSLAYLCSRQCCCRSTRLKSYVNFFFSVPPYFCPSIARTIFKCVFLLKLRVFFFLSPFPPPLLSSPLTLSSKTQTHSVICCCHTAKLLSNGPNRSRLSVRPSGSGSAFSFRPLLSILLQSWRHLGRPTGEQKCF